MAYIHAVNLAGVDLNLLVALEALLAERSVSRAAARVGLSQPAMSNALGRLRALLDDPVLIRAAGAMVPSPRARQLVEPIRHALGEIQNALDRAPKFDPGLAWLRGEIARTAASDGRGSALRSDLSARPGLTRQTRRQR